MIIMAPSDESETRKLLANGAGAYQGPAAVRYPARRGHRRNDRQVIDHGADRQSSRSPEGQRVALLAFGNMVRPALVAAETLNATVVDMRFVKPLDESCILQFASTHDLLVTLEDHALMGGAGSAVSELLHREAVQVPLLDWDSDAFIEHGKPVELHESPAGRRRHSKNGSNPSGTNLPIRR